MSKNQYPKCIIFADSKILLNTETILISVLLDLAIVHHMEIELDEAVRLFSGNELPEIIQIINSAYERCLPKAFEQQLHLMLNKELNHHIAPLEGAVNLLHHLEIPYCIVSNTTNEEVRFKLQLAGLSDFFTGANIFSFHDFQYPTADQTTFHYAAHQMGFHPNQCAVIDSNLNSIKNAARYFKVYGFSNGFNKKIIEAHGAVAFEHLLELSKLLIQR